MSTHRAPRRVAIVGAECTGKTTLADALVARLPALGVSEWLREFCDLHGRTPRADEQRALIEEQCAREARALDAAARAGLDWVVCDSSPLVTALYSIEIFGDASLLPAALEYQRGYAMTLWTDVDLAWEADGIQRDGAAARASFHTRIAAVLRAQRIAHRRISGPLSDRVDVAVFHLREASRV